MLLYVDKKKQKRRRLKIIITTLASLFFLCANIIFFSTRLQQTKQHLTNFHPQKQTSAWYKNSDIVTIFTQNKHQHPHAIIIPEKINRENLLIIALAFSKMGNTPFTVELTPDVKESLTLQKLATLYNTSPNTPKHKIHISTDINALSDLIKTKRLHPTTLHYQNTKKLKQTNELQTLLDTTFPLPAEPQTQLEQEQYALKSFALTYHNELQNFFTDKPQKIAFTNQNLFLQNVGICLMTDQTRICELNNTSSLQANIRTALEKISTKPQKLLLLTSKQEIKPNTFLAGDEGAIFEYGNRHALLLPHEKDEKINTYTLLKQKAGLNPDYYSKDMKFYKFKTTEIDINDNI